MPCYSRTTATQMKDAERLAAALEAQGHKVATKNATMVSTEDGLTFTRGSNTTSAFDYQGSPTKTLAAIGRKYAEITARTWAKKNQLNVRRADETGMLLVSTRS